MTLFGCSSRGSQSAHSALSAGCSTRVDTVQKRLERPISAAVPGYPTAVVGTTDGRWAFVSISTGNGGAVGVMALGQASPRLVRLVALPTTFTNAFGMALTPGGQLLLVAGYTATAVLSVPALETGSGGAVTGVLADAGTGQFEVTVSADGHYAFVTDETSGGLSVFNLAIALQHGFSAPGVAVGIVPLAYGAVGIATSPDGQELYATTFGAYGPHGQLWVIDAARAERGATRVAVVRHVAAGCQPVRVAVAPDGHTVWVTALQSNALLAFSAARLETDPAKALQAVVRVGSEPVGLLLIDNGRLALVCNSNRGLVAGTGSAQPQTVSVVSTAAALNHRPALIGVVPTGLFPRDITFDRAAGRVVVANYDSGSIEEFPAPAAP